MKHEVINTPSTHNVLRMMFECKTFDAQNEEKSVRRFETKVKVKHQASQLLFRKRACKSSFYLTLRLLKKTIKTENINIASLEAAVDHKSFLYQNLMQILSKN